MSADGWLAGLGALDFAGGTVVHINAGAAALVAALVVRPRRDYGRQALVPHNVPFVLLGAGLLWFGWFGFNAGSALGANSKAAIAFVNTMLAPCATLTVWMLLDFFRSGRPTAVGAATGIVVGLVAVTPAAGFVSPLGALAIGAIAAVPSYFVIRWRSKTRLDDSLDVVAAHGLGGLTGALLTGVFAEKAWGGVDGLLAGNPRQLLIQLIACAVTVVYSGVASFVILKTIGFFVPLRSREGLEATGMDLTMHEEEAYASGEGAILLDEQALFEPGANVIPGLSASPSGATGGAA